MRDREIQRDAMKAAGSKATAATVATMPPRTARLTWNMQKRAAHSFMALALIVVGNQKRGDRDVTSIPTPLHDEPCQDIGPSPQRRDGKPIANRLTEQ